MTSSSDDLRSYLTFLSREVTMSRSVPRSEIALSALLISTGISSPKDAEISPTITAACASDPSALGCSFQLLILFIRLISVTPYFVLIHFITN